MSFIMCFNQLTTVILMSFMHLEVNFSKFFSIIAQKSHFLSTWHNPHHDGTKYIQGRMLRYRTCCCCCCGCCWPQPLLPAYREAGSVFRCMISPKHFDDRQFKTKPLSRMLANTQQLKVEICVFNSKLIRETDSRYNQLKNLAIVQDNCIS